MPDRRGDDGIASSADGSEPTVDESQSTVDESESPSGAVDDEVKRRLREAYLNDEEHELIVTAVRSVGDRVRVELRTPHGDATHTERFAAPRDGSLAESERFLALLEAAGVSPLDVDELVGTRVPATYDPEAGWRIDPEYLGEPERGVEARLAGLREWLWTYRAWLLAALLVGGELAFVVAIILVYA